jgi:Tol biopolymer transport system component
MRKALIVASVVAGAAGVATHLAAGYAVTYPGGSGRLAFAVNRGNADIYTVASDGTDVQRLTSGTSFDACPSWSRDGKTMAYCSDASGAFEIWTMRADGTGKHRETNIKSNATFPDISPDGRRIVFSDCAATCRLMVVDRATGKTSVIVDDRRAHDTDPVWSPDGKQIAFLRAPHGGALAGAQLFLARADGSAVRQLTRDRRPKGPFGPDWNPNGTQLAYTSAGDIWTVDLGGRTHRLTRTTSSEWAPSWSPGGSQIAVIHRTQGRRVIYIMRANGTNARPLAPSLAGPHLAPSWQPLVDR